MKVEVGIGELHGVSNNIIYLRLVRDRFIP